MGGAKSVLQLLISLNLKPRLKNALHVLLMQSAMGEIKQRLSLDTGAQGDILFTFLNASTKQHARAPRMINLTTHLVPATQAILDLSVHLANQATPVTPSMNAASVLILRLIS